jgi:hypothetical protein
MRRTALNIRQMHKEMNNVLGMLHGTVGKENRLVQFLEITALLLDALAIRYPDQEPPQVIDALHDEAYEKWEKTEKAKETMRDDTAH